MIYLAIEKDLCLIMYTVGVYITGHAYFTADILHTIRGKQT